MQGPCQSSPCRSIVVAATTTQLQLSIKVPPLNPMRLLHFLSNHHLHHHLPNQVRARPRSSRPSCLSTRLSSGLVTADHTIDLSFCSFTVSVAVNCCLPPLQLPIATTCNLIHLPPASIAATTTSYSAATEPQLPPSVACLHCSSLVALTCKSPSAASLHCSYHFLLSSSTAATII